jgi:hypothetical protein
MEFEKKLSLIFDLFLACQRHFSRFFGFEPKNMKIDVHNCKIFSLIKSQNSLNSPTPHLLKKNTPSQMGRSWIIIPFDQNFGDPRVKVEKIKTKLARTKKKKFTTNKMKLMWKTK